MDGWMDLTKGGMIEGHRGEGSPEVIGV